MEVAGNKTQALALVNTVNSPNKKRKKAAGFKLRRETLCFHCYYSTAHFVNCSRKDCQKVYHLDCIGAQDSNDLTKWQCSWHFCNECKKAAQYTCYTCHNSFCKMCIKESDSSCKLCFKESKTLCKKCVKESNFLSVNRSKGFCKICIGRVIKAENNEQGCQEIFRSYWNTVKTKFRQTERTEIINRFKGSISLVCKDKSDGQLDDPSNNSGSASDNLEEGRSKRRKLRRCIDSSYQTGCNEGISVLCGTDWACKELLDFVALVKNGDASYLPDLDVRALLMEYIKRNNLRDPQYQNQINCDQRLTALFGKACIKHFEMLKYLSSHLLKNESQAIQAIAVEKHPSQVKTVDHREPQREVVGKLCKTSKQILPENMGNDSASDTNDDGKVLQTILIKGPNVRIVSEQKPPQAVSEYAAIDSQSPIGDISKTSKKEAGYKRSKFYKILEHRLLQTKTDDYASIDAHNINLLYLKRDLLETMLELEDIDDKVIGSFVRITSSSSEKPERYRLVKVVGIDKARQPYSVGEKKTNIMLKISSSGKTESLEIDSVSDQDFSEDECNCLRERIKSGIDNQIMVREVEKKVLDLQELRVNFLLEKEMLTLRNRGDYLGEKGQRKEQQKLIMQCQLLSSSEELLRRIKEIPDIHSDPDMNLVNKAQDDAKSDYKRDSCMQQTNIGLHSEELNKNMVEKNPVTAPESSTSMVDIANAFDGKTDEPLLKEDEVQVIPEVHADLNLSNMAQDDAKSDDTRRDNYTSQTFVPIGFGERIDEPSWKQDEVQEILETRSDPNLNSVNKAEGDASSDDNRQDIGIHDVDKKLDSDIVENYSMTSVEPTTDVVDIANDFGERTCEPSRKQDEHKNPVVASVLDNGTLGLILAGSNSTSRSMTDKLWHYEDPSGIIQGPFSMLQLCKWSTTSSFSANMRVWRKEENPEDSLLLTDALNNTFSHPPRVPAINQCNRVHNVIDDCDIEKPLTPSSFVTVNPMEDLNSSGASNPLPSQLASDPPPMTLLDDLIQVSKTNLSSSQLASSPKANCGDLHAVFRADALHSQMKAENCSSTGLEVDDHDTAEKDSQSVQPMERLHGASASCASQPNSHAHLQSLLACDLPQQDVSITDSNNVAFVGEGNADIMKDFKDDLANSQLIADSGHDIFGINELTSLSTSSTVLVNSEEDLLLSCPVVTSEDRISPSNDLSPTTFLESCIGSLIQDGRTDVSQQSSSPNVDHLGAIPAVLHGVVDNPSARSEVNGEQIGNFDRLANASIETQGFVEPPPHPASDETSIDSKESKQELALVSCDKLNNNNEGQNSLVEESSPGAEENDFEVHWDAAVEQNKRSLELFSCQSKNDDGQTRILLTRDNELTNENQERNSLVDNSAQEASVDETTLYVRNLNYDVDEQILYNEFCAFGAMVRKPRILRDSVTGNPSCGFITYESVDNSRAAMEVMNGRCLKDRLIKVAYARKKDTKEESHGTPIETQGFRTSKKLYIGNLDETVDEKVLYDRFSEFGAIVETRTIKRDLECGGCFGFITYKSIDMARRALDATKGQMFHGRPMNVNYAKEGSRQLNNYGYYQEDKRNSHDGCRDINVGGDGGARGYVGGFNRGGGGMGYGGGINRSGGGRRGYMHGGVRVYSGDGLGNERDYSSSREGSTDSNVRGGGGREYGGGGWRYREGCSSGHYEESIPPSNLESGVGTFIQDCKTDVIDSPEICERVADGSEIDSEKITPPFDSSVIEAQGFTTNTKTLYVGNLDYSVDEKILQDRFSEFGTILKTRLVERYHDTGTSRSRFGFVTYDSIETAHRAMDATNGENLCGCRMNVDFAKEEFRGSLTEKAHVQGSRQLKNDGWHHEDRRESGEGCRDSYIRSGGGGGRGGGWRNQSNYNSDHIGVAGESRQFKGWTWFLGVLPIYGSRGRGDFSSCDRGRGFNIRGRSSGYGYCGRGSLNTNGRLDCGDGYGNKQR